MSQQNKTIMLKKKDLKHEWYVLDASGKTLGRFAAEVAKVLRGKHKPTYTPYEDCGDGVIIINADKIKVTGNKAATKLYTYYTGYMSGLRQVPYRTMMARKPGYIVEHAVKGMMPGSRLGRQQAKRLRIFVGEDHQMEAQKPIKANI
jgi:large subunit ribosomal protein L13